MYKRLKELGLECEEYCYDRPASNFSLYEDSLYVDASCQFEALACNNYAPEVYADHFDFERLFGSRKAKGYKNGIIIEVAKFITDEYVRYKYIKMLEESFSYTSRRYKSLGRTIEETIRGLYKSDCEYGDDYIKGYMSLRINHDDTKFVENLYGFIDENKSYFDGHLKLSEDYYCINIITGKDEEDIIYVTNENIYVGNSSGYKAYEQDEDIKHMSNVGNFMNVISDFAPISELTVEDRIKLRRLYEKDCENHCLSCDVYMGTTD